MRKIQITLLALLAALTVLWLLVDTLAPQPFTYFAFRNVFIQYSGIIGISVMSVAMLLAMRPVWVEPYLGGLDKMYRLHKWLGITGLVMSIAHWWFATGTKWMVGWGWLERPARGRPPAEATTNLMEGWLHSQRGLAESVGEWAFYIAALLLVLALIKRFPYHLFTKTHKWLAVTYLALVFHSAVLVKFNYWSQPIGWVVMLLMLGGTVAAVLILAGRIGVKRKVTGVIDQINYYPELHVLEISIQLADGWQGHYAGQFAFVTSDKQEGAHPYTLASAWDPSDKHITFITKMLGDHTARLRDQLKVDMPVTVEGPYGCFDFNDNKPRQIWIGAGIGITPFIAQMKQLAKTPRKQAIDLFHPTTAIDAVVADKLKADVQAAGIKAHVLISPRDGVLDGKRIRAAVPDWQAASIWFCGPAGFGQAIRQDFIAHGLNPHDFHQELFEMR